MVHLNICVNIHTKQGMNPAGLRSGLSCSVFAPILTIPFTATATLPLAQGKTLTRKITGTMTAQEFMNIETVIV